MTKFNEKFKSAKLNFIPGSVQLLSVRPSSIPNKTRFTQVQKAGIRYENRVSKYLSFRFGSDNYAPKQWIRYDYVGGKYPTHVELDGVVIDRKTKTLKIVEMKLTHTFRAFHQLEVKYRPLIEDIFPDWNVHIVEICSQVFDTMEDADYVYIDDINFTTSPHSKYVWCLSPAVLTRLLEAAKK